MHLTSARRTASTASVSRRGTGGARERKTDIPALVQHFVILRARELRLPDVPALAPGALDYLREYRWPGAVRELAN
jgi:DNA-binding NtrC family response regulator